MQGKVHVSPGRQPNTELMLTLPPRHKKSYTTNTQIDISIGWELVQELDVDFCGGKGKIRY